MKKGSTPAGTVKLGLNIVDEIVASKAVAQLELRDKQCMWQVRVSGRVKSWGQIGTFIASAKWPKLGHMARMPFTTAIINHHPTKRKTRSHFPYDPVADLCASEHHNTSMEDPTIVPYMEGLVRSLHIVTGQFDKSLHEARIWIPVRGEHIIRH